MRTRYPGTHIDAALEAYRPVLEAQYIRTVTNVYERMRKDLGINLDNVYNDARWCRTFNSMVRNNVTALQYEAGAPKRVIKEKALDTAKLSTNASNYSAEIVEAWASKIVSKLGSLDYVQVRRLDGCSFCITGEVRGHSVVLNQQIIINVSNRGTLFNQFPSRIYVDGKFMSEADYKAAFNK